MTSFYLFYDYDVIPPMTPHPYDVTIIFLDDDVIIFYDINSLGYFDVINAPTPLSRTPNSILLLSTTRVS